MSDLNSPQQRKASLGQTIVAVASSFVGVRAGKAHQKDVTQLNPVVTIAVGIGLALLFIFTLIFVVKLVLAK
jgi:Protein of unknown function (DUF2970)